MASMEFLVFNQIICRQFVVQNCSEIYFLQTNFDFLSENWSDTKGQAKRVVNTSSENIKTIRAFFVLSLLTD